MRDPSLAGRVTLRFTIGANGHVDNSLVSETTWGNVNAEACIQTGSLGWVFPPPDDGGIAIVNNPFEFRAVSEDSDHAPDGTE